MTVSGHPAIPRFARRKILSPQGGLLFLLLLVAGCSRGDPGPAATPSARAWAPVKLLDLAERVSPPPEDSRTIRFDEFSIADHRQWGLFLHPPNEFVFPPVDLAPETTLRFEYGILSKAWDHDGDGVTFRVKIRRPEGAGAPREELVFQRHLDPGNDATARQWNHASVQLPDGGGPAQIVLETLPGPAGNRGYDWAVWSNVLLLPLGVGSPTRPNVVLITLDTTRADHLSVYGYSEDTTPFLNSVAGEFRIFDRAYSPSTWTLPAHASLFTGLFPRQHGAITEFSGEDLGGFPLADSFQTLAEVLQQDGYFTMGVVGGLFLRRYYHLDQGFLLYSDLWNGPARNAAEINNVAFAWLDRLEDQPFFLFLNYFDPHAPYDPAGYAANDEDLFRAHGIDIHRFQPSDLKHHGMRQLPAEVVAALKRRYDEEIRRMDRAIGDLVDQLRARGLYENTILCIVGDHGESFGEHEVWGHGGAFFNSQAHVPFLYRRPGRKADTGRVAEPVSTLLIPSMVALDAGIAVPEQIARNVSTTGAAIPVFGERFTRTGSMEMLLDFPLKYLVWKDAETGTQTERLFDLSIDPDETTDVLAGRPADVRQLRADFRALAERIRPPATIVAEGPKLSNVELEDLRQRLRSLGYVN